MQVTVCVSLSCPCRTVTKARLLQSNFASKYVVSISWKAVPSITHAPSPAQIWKVGKKLWEGQIEREYQKYKEHSAQSIANILRKSKMH